MPFIPQYEAMASIRRAMRSNSGPAVSDRSSLQPQLPALLRVGIDHAHQRLRVLGDVAPALVEELERQRDVCGIDVLDVAQKGGVGHAVAPSSVERGRDQALEARRQCLEAEAHGSAAPASGPGV